MAISTESVRILMEIVGILMEIVGILMESVGILMESVGILMESVRISMESVRNLVEIEVPPFSFSSAVLCFLFSQLPHHFPPLVVVVFSSFLS